ncbi:unnamed protein product [Echinostoma caproni]|uniref:C2H2-type domain-containing protein n=1 Tax=Echinostoma caproni TaxID=27848 RepID=A0A183B0C0_9TREM|nr:unnamed protein product [Echinostoma caproni]
MNEKYLRMKSLEDSHLLDQLKEVFRQHFRHCQRLEVVGILSYTTDNNTEKFIKLDFSTVKGSGTRDSHLDSESMEYCQVGNRDSCMRNPAQVLEALRDPTDFKESSSPANASPPLLPPLVIQNTRVSRGANVCSTTAVLDSVCSMEIAESPKDLVDGPIHRRDRRKSRRPKRQIIDSENRNADSEVEDGATEQDEVVSSSDPEMFRSGKVPRLSCSSNAAISSQTMSVLSQNKFITTRIIQESSPAASEHNHQFADQAHIPNSEPVVSVSQVPSTKTSEICFRGPDVQPQTTATAKYTIATKTLGLGELGEFCGLLPLNNILNRTILSCHDNNSLTVKVAPQNNGATNPLIIPIPETTPHIHTNQGVIPVTSHTASTPNVLLNPNIAAAVAAALSATSQAPVSTVTYSDHQNVSGITSFNGPSIALTGPSGEIIGTIPIGSTGQQHGLLPSVLGTALASHSSNVGSAVNTVSVSVPISSGANGGSSLATTLNWLRCASANTEVAHHNPLPQQSSISTNSQTQAANNSVALLQSLAGQNAVHQLSSAPGKVSSISVGPTLALIGTLGLNPTPASSSSMSNNEAMPSVSAGTTNATLLTTNLGLNTNNNNNAALVAAALLRGLAGAKNATAEVSESTCLETNVGGIPGSVTLIPGGQMSSGGLTTGRPSMIASDGSLTSLSNILSSKMINATSVTPSTATFSMYETPVCSATNLNRIGQNSQLLNGVSNAITRGSIMLSYPRGQGEMNVLLAPASAQSLSAGSLPSVAAIPTAISFQNILSPQTTSVTLAPPVLLHTQLSNPGAPKNPTTVCTTSTVSTTLAVSPSVLPPIRCKSSSTDHKPITDPTTSAIDRILQTIKGCMNNENRENESKQKFASITSKKTEPVENTTSSSKSTFDDTSGELNPSGESKQSYSLKLVSSSVPVVKTNSVVSQSEQSSKSADGGKVSATTGERAPLVPIAKDPNDHENPPTYRVTKVYRCRYCGKTFNRKFCRERHERLHTGVKPYTCEICEEKFIRLEDKKRHVRSLQHYLAGRGAFLKVESGDGTCEDNAALGIDPSTVLPLLTQTLQGGGQEGVNGGLVELDETAGLSPSEDTSNDQGSDCESSDAEECPEKMVSEFHSSGQSNMRIGTPDDSSDAPELRHTPVSCGDDEESAGGVPETEVQAVFTESQPCLVLSAETPVFNKDESHPNSSSKGTNVVSMTSVVLINGDDLQASIPSS